MGDFSGMRLATHTAAVMLGAAGAIALQSYAITDTATMLGQLKSGDYEGLRRYLQITDSDNEARSERWATRWTDIQQRLDRLDQITAKLGPLSSKVDQLGARLDQLDTKTDAQLADVQKQIAANGHSVVAPFSVVDERTHKPVLMVTASADGGMVKIMNVAGTAPAVSLYPMTDGGRVMVHNPSGREVVAMGGLSGGGMVSVMGPNGGSSAVKLAVERGGGTVKVYTSDAGPGISPLAELSATEGFGAVSVYQSGRVSGMLYSGKSQSSGFIELHAGSEDLVVQMGPDTKGAGVVRVGPKSRGPAGTMGGGLAVASEIHGYSGGISALSRQFSLSSADTTRCSGPSTIRLGG